MNNIEQPAVTEHAPAPSAPQPNEEGAKSADPYSLIDLLDNTPSQVNWQPMQPTTSTDGPHSFVQDLAGLQVPTTDIEKPIGTFSFNIYINTEFSCK